jgi:UDP-4-amino-4,6-dideoxy-N-acetyl-beta-L-altrosamine transaminase
MIPYGKQEILEEDIEAVVKILRSDYLTQGPAIPAFENSLQEYCGVKYSVVVNSCTSALHLACLALGLESGDIVWTSPITFVASANCALYCGATIDFVDVDPDTALLSITALKYKLEQAQKEGNLPKIVIPVHFSGQPCDMKEIHMLGKKYGFSIIEDAAHAIGASYKGEPVGNCRYSDITVFSFHPVKIITTGEGGAAMTNNPELAERMALLRSHGITRDPNKTTNKLDKSWYYEQIDLGYNYRITDIQAALGASQLNRLDKYVARRLEISDWYDRQFKDYPIDPLIRKDDRQSSHHLYVVKVRGDFMIRNEIFENLRNSGINVNLHYIPVYKQPYFKMSKTTLNGAEEYYNKAISLPIFPSIEIDSLKKVVSKVLSQLS